MGWSLREDGEVYKEMPQNTIGQAQFYFDELHTVIVEIEGIINFRPISYLNSDDVEQPLTPSHLLVRHRILNLPDNLAHYEEREMKSLRSLMKCCREEPST